MLGVSSLFSAWGVAGRYTLIAELLPAEHRIAGNTIFGLTVHVAADLHGSAALLGTFWAIVGVGAIVGELAAPYLRRLPTWPTMTAIVLGWGVALLPLGLRTPLWVGPAAFCAGAVIWGPWTSLSMAVFQEAALPGALASVLAARSALLTMATPLGTALGGPMIAALGARGTLLVSALTTIMLGLIAIAVLIYRRRRSLLVPGTCAPGTLCRLPRYRHPVPGLTTPCPGGQAEG